MSVPPTVVFTKFQNHLNDIKAKISESEDAEDLSKSELAERLSTRSKEVISSFFTKVSDALPACRFFLFDPSRGTSDIKAYKF
jgi:hypothetical protein